MPSDRPILTPRLVVGLFILALGTLFLLDNLKLAEARHIVPYLWPAGFIALGITTVLRRWGGRGWAWGLVWIVAGVWLLGDQLGIVHFNFWELFWPLMLLLVGASFVWRAIAGPSSSSSSCSSSSGANSDDVVNLFAMMAGNERRNSSAAFRGGDVSAFMGGCALDLRQAQLADGEAVIDLFAFWGGIELKVPEEWEVVSKVMVLMGGVEDKTKPRVGAVKGRLVLRGLALMGGIEISN